MSVTLRKSLGGFPAPTQSENAFNVQQCIWYHQGKARRHRVWAEQAQRRGDHTQVATHLKLACEAAQCATVYVGLLSTNSTSLPANK